MNEPKNIEVRKATPRQLRKMLNEQVQRNVELGLEGQKLNQDVNDWKRRYLELSEDFRQERLQQARTLQGAAQNLHEAADRIHELNATNHRLKCYVDVLLTALADAQGTAQSPFPKAA